MDSTELEQLRAQVAALEARLAPVPAMLPVTRRPDSVYVPPITVKIAELQASGPLRYHTIREVRQLATAVALSRGDELPGALVPVSYEPAILSLAPARAEGLTWRAALERCGLEVPDDVEIAHQARALRGQLRGLWDSFEGLLGPVSTVISPVAQQNLVESLRRLLT